MRSQRLGIFALVALMGGFVVLSASSAVAGVNDREHRQRDRIRDGVHDGSLTPVEARRLGREQLRIERAERRLRANDGHLGPRERVRLNRKLNRSNRHIRRARHNDRAQ